MKIPEDFGKCCRRVVGVQPAWIGQDPERRFRQRLRLTTLEYQELDDLVAAIGLPKEKLCTYCWDGVG